MNTSNNEPLLRKLNIDKKINKNKRTFLLGTHSIRKKNNRFSNNKIRTTK
jgi:hypothetical protein